MQGPIRDRLEELLTTLRAPEEVEPAPGFYARVLQRIEAREDSFWAFFVDSPFSKRMALASLTIAVALGSYVISAERHEGSAAQNMVAFSGTHYDAPVMGSQAEQRDAVLENFAEHHGIESQGQIR